MLFITSIYSLLLSDLGLKAVAILETVLSHLFRDLSGKEKIKNLQSNLSYNAEYVHIFTKKDNILD